MQIESEARRGRFKFEGQRLECELRRGEERARRGEGGARRGRMRRGEGGFELRGTLAALVLGNSRWWSALHARAHLSLSLTHELTQESSRRPRFERACKRIRSHARAKEVEFLRATWLRIRCAGARMQPRGSSSLAS